MKKILLTIMVACGLAANAYAQKYATVDIEYILKNIPAYERANEQLTQQPKRWQGEIDDLTVEAQNLYDSPTQRVLANDSKRR